MYRQAATAQRLRIAHREAVLTVIVVATMTAGSVNV